MAARSLHEIKTDLRAAELRVRVLRAELLAALKLPANRASRWKGVALELLRSDYETTTLKLRGLAEKHRTSAGCVCNLAAVHGWVRLAIDEEQAARAAKLHALAERHSGASAP